MNQSQYYQTNERVEHIKPSAKQERYMSECPY